MSNMSKLADDEYRSLSALLDSLPDPSSYTTAKSMTAERLEDMIGPGEAQARQLQMDRTRMEKALTGDRNFSIACELGVRYPTLRAMMNRDNLHLRTSVRFHINVYAYMLRILKT